MTGLRSDWMERWFRPQYGNTYGSIDRVLAPDLDTAFKLARCMWPTATAWLCLGKVGNKVEATHD